MKVLFVLLASHILVCAAVGYLFGKWVPGETRQTSPQAPDNLTDAPLPENDGQITQDNEGFFLDGETIITETIFTFTLPRPVKFYFVSGLFGIVVAFAVELYFGSTARS